MTKSCTRPSHHAIHNITIIAVSWLALMSLPGCSSARKMTYSPAELRHELKKQTSLAAPIDVVVPFEVPPEQVAKARRAVGTIASRSERARSLKDVMFDPKGFGLRYTEVITRTAAETLEKGEGNCLSLAAVYVGLARGIGLRANFLDASNRIEEVHADEDVVVKTGHVTAVVYTENGKAALDFGQRFGPFQFFRVMDDMEATAHFYNNRGYELIHEAQQESRPIDWNEVARNFLMATRVRKGFVRAWNNLGVAYVRLGRLADARACYEEAIALDPEFASPRTNLGILLMESGDLKAAYASFNEAARLDPDSPRTHYHRGLLLFKQGKFEKSATALKRAIDLKTDYDLARKLLARVYLHLGRPTDARRVSPSGEPGRGDYRIGL
jgi:hypothetical protein